MSEPSVSPHKQPKRGKSTALIMKQDTSENVTPMRRRRSSGIISNKECTIEGPKTSPKNSNLESSVIVVPRQKPPSLFLGNGPASMPAKRPGGAKNRRESQSPTSSDPSAISSNCNTNVSHSESSMNESRSGPSSARGADSATDSPIRERSTAKENRRRLRNSVMFNLQVLERELKEIERNKLTDEDLDLLMIKSSTGSGRRPKLKDIPLVNADAKHNNGLDTSENAENTALNLEVDPQQQKRARLSLSDNSVFVRRQINFSEDQVTVVASGEYRERSPRENNLDPNTYLKCINMANNIISNLSPNAFMFPLLHCALEILDLSNNLLEYLPPEISLLKRLQQLSVQRNFLKELPKEIGELKYLKTLYAYNNFLENIPDEITRCKNLRAVHLQNNKLASIPLELASISLEDLQVNIK